MSCEMEIGVDAVWQIWMERYNSCFWFQKGIFHSKKRFISAKILLVILSGTQNDNPSQSVVRKGTLSGYLPEMECLPLRVMLQFYIKFTAVGVIPKLLVCNIGAKKCPESKAFKSR